MYEWLNIDDAKGFEQLHRLDSCYDPMRVAKKFGQSLSKAIRGVLIEYQYIDKDYRSTLYGYYAKKGRRYLADCVRLHFFDERVQFSAERLELSCIENDQATSISEHYFGYVVLRPTLHLTIGRSLLSPNIRSGTSGRVISAVHKVHVLGYKLSVDGFPSMDQHGDLAVCAHVACWSILRHYSQRFPQHAEVLLHEVTRMAHQFEPGGIRPSLGLVSNDAERVFHAAKTFPITVPKGKGAPNISLFFSQLMAYLESGFPLFVSMLRDPHAPTPIGHAVVLIGKHWKPSAKVLALQHDNDGSSIPVDVGGPAYRAWQLVSEFVVVDDNDLPYKQIGGPGGGGASADYSADSLSRFIVALPEKIYYPATAVEKQAKVLFKVMSTRMKLPAAAKTIVRYFITTLSRFREEVRSKITQFDPKFFDVVMNLPAAQFIWVIEYSSPEQWDAGLISARVVLDATASSGDAYPAWLAHDKEAAIVFDRATGNARDTAFLPLSGLADLTRLDLNLQPVINK